MESKFYRSKHFIGLGIMISVKDNPIINKEYILFEIRLIIFNFWILKYIK